MTSTQSPAVAGSTDRTPVKDESSAPTQHLQNSRREPANKIVKDGTGHDDKLQEPVEPGEHVKPVKPVGPEKLIGLV